MHRATVGSYGGGGSYERGSHVGNTRDAPEKLGDPLEARYVMILNVSFLDLYQSRAGLVMFFRDILKQRGQPPEKGKSRWTCIKKPGVINVPDLASIGQSEQ